jgi:precorrin-8X/cobalt-precorrin-8 methylmutase
MAHSQYTTPRGIEERSFAIIESEIPEPRPFQGKEWSVVRRIIHATADLELLEAIRFHREAVSRGLTALSRGCLVLTDSNMTRAGITSGRMTRLGCSVRCDLDDPWVKEQAAEKNRTRSAMAVRKAAEDLGGAIFVVGNAPTSLSELLDLCAEQARHPELIVGMPVGFVGAAEAKERLAEQKDIPFITLIGRKGGSSAAAAAVNGLAEIALEGMG